MGTVLLLKKLITEIESHCAIQLISNCNTTRLA